MGSPQGGFFSPYLEGADEFVCLAANVLCSLQFSYLMLKGFSATSRALKEVGTFGKLSQRGFGPSGARGVTAVSSRSSLRIGRTAGRVDVGFGGVPKKQRSARTNFRTRAVSDKGAAGQDGPIPGSGKCKGGHAERGMERNPGDSTQNGSSSNLNYGSDAVGEGYSTDSHGFNGLDFEGTRHPAETVLVSKFSSPLTNRTFSITGLGVSLRLKPMGKGFAKGVKMASGVVKGVKTATGVLQRFSGPAESVVMGFGAANGVIMGYEAAKFIVSSAKISKDFVSVWKLTKKYRDTAAANAASAAKSSLGGKTIRESLQKTLKASDGALTFVKLAREFSGGAASSFPSGLSSWDLFTKSYEVSSGVLKVGEVVAMGWKGGLVSLLGKGFATVKGAVSGFGVVVKTVMLTKEISVVVIKGIGLWKGSKKALKVIKEKRESGDFFFFKMKKEDSSCQDRWAFSKVRADTMILPITCAHPHCQLLGKDAPAFSLIPSLASLLYADFECSVTREDLERKFNLSSLDLTWAYFFHLGLPLEELNLHFF